MSEAKKIDLGKLVKLKSVKKVQAKRFDYEQIRNDLVKLGDNGLFVTMGKIQEVMGRHDRKGGLIWYNQVRQMIYRLDARKDTEVLVDADASPRLYLIRSIKTKNTK